MKNISIGYNSNEVAQPTWALKLRLFATGSNLITIPDIPVWILTSKCEFRLEQWYGQLCLSQCPFGDVWIGFDLLTYKSVCRL